MDLPFSDLILPFEEVGKADLTVDDIHAQLVPNVHIVRHVIQLRQFSNDLLEFSQILFLDALDDLDSEFEKSFFNIDIFPLV